MYVCDVGGGFSIYSCLMVSCRIERRRQQWAGTILERDSDRYLDINSGIDINSNFECCGVFTSHSHVLLSYEGTNDLWRALRRTLKDNAANQGNHLTKISKYHCMVFADQA